MPSQAPNVYTGMLLAAVAACVVGCGTVAWELTSDYDWTTEAKGGPAINIQPRGSGAVAVGGPAGRAMPQLHAINAPVEAVPVGAGFVDPGQPAPIATPNTAPPPDDNNNKPNELPPQAVPDPAAAVSQPKPAGLVPSPLKLPGGGR
jgi:hypothetical protein